MNGKQNQQQAVKKLIGLLDKVADVLVENDLRLFANAGELVIYHKDRPFQESKEGTVIAIAGSMIDLVDGGDV